MPEAHRQAVIEVLGEECLRPFGLDEVQEMIAELGFVCRGRELGRRKFGGKKRSLRHKMPPKTPRASSRQPSALPCLRTGIGRRRSELLLPCGRVSLPISRGKRDFEMQRGLDPSVDWKLVLAFPPIPLIGSAPALEFPVKVGQLIDG